MYKFITVARHVSQAGVNPTYIYMDTKTNKYYITLNYPKYAVFNGAGITDNTTYPLIGDGLLLTEDNLTQGRVSFFSLEYSFKID
jgi:hypothetical protein